MTSPSDLAKEVLAEALNNPLGIIIQCDPTRFKNALYAARRADPGA